jgi:hypothetical protein
LISSLEREAGAAHHVRDRHRQRLRQGHAAMLGRGGDGDPAALGDGAIALGEAGRCANHPVLKPGRMQVARPLQRRHHLFAELSGLGQDLGRQIGRRLGETRGRGDLREADDVIEDEAELLDGGTVCHADLPEASRLVPGPARLYVSGRLRARAYRKAPRHQGQTPRQERRA